MSHRRPRSTGRTAPRRSSTRDDRPPRSRASWFAVELVRGKETAALHDRVRAHGCGQGTDVPTPNGADTSAVRFLASPQRTPLAAFPLPFWGVVVSGNASLLQRSCK